MCLWVHVHIGRSWRELQLFRIRFQGACWQIDLSFFLMCVQRNFWYPEFEWVLVANASQGICCWELKTLILGMGSNGIDHCLAKQVLEKKKGLRQMDGGDDDNQLVIVDVKSQHEKFDSASSKEAEDWKANLGQQSSQATTSSPRKGLCCAH